MKKISGRGKKPLNRTEVDGTVQAAKGKVETAVGKVTGNERTQAHGQVEETKGKVKQKIGQIESKVT
jgi:uncharacterized protein YjbJ (UPF0337 family)